MIIRVPDARGHEASVEQCAIFLHPCVTMGERLKRAWAGYQKYKLITRIISAFTGAIAGISGCIAYAKVYHNYNAATWAAVSAAFAIIFLRLNFSVRRDHERLITIETFTAFMWVGIVGLIAGLIAFITYIVLGATHHEHGKKYRTVHLSFVVDFCGPLLLEIFRDSRSSFHILA